MPVNIFCGIYFITHPMSTIWVSIDSSWRGESNDVYCELRQHSKKERTNCFLWHQFVGEVYTYLKELLSSTLQWCTQAYHSEEGCELCRLWRTALLQKKKGVGKKVPDLWFHLNCEVIKNKLPVNYFYTIININGKVVELWYIQSREEQLKIVRACHSDPTSGHLGTKKNKP